MSMDSLEKYKIRQKKSAEAFIHLLPVGIDRSTEPSFIAIFYAVFTSCTLTMENDVLLSAFLHRLNVFSPITPFTSHFI